MLPVGLTQQEEDTVEAASNCFVAVVAVSRKTGVAG